MEKETKNPQTHTKAATDAQSPAKLLTGTTSEVTPLAKPVSIRPR